MVKAFNGVARILKAEGVPFVTLFPSCRLNNAMGEEGVPIIMMRDERFAVAVADAFSRVSNGKKFGVCTVQGGVNASGLEFAMGAIAQAFEDSTPLLCLTDAVELAQTENSHFHPDRVFAHLTKWTTRIDAPSRLPALMARAFTHLKTGRPGPVLLQFPRTLGEYDDNEFPYEPVEPCRSQADPANVTSVIRALLRARQPLIYAGQGVFYADACEELQQFAELVQAPVLTTLKAKSAFPENHPLSVGVRGEPADHFLEGADFILAIGSSLSPHRFSHAIPDARHKTIATCTVDTADLNRIYRTRWALIGDAQLVLRQLIEESGRQTGGGARRNPQLLDEIAGARRQMQEKYLPLLTASGKPINPYRVYHELMNALDGKNSFVTGDSGSTRDQLSTIYEAVVPHGFMGWGNVSTLGFSYAAAFGAKLAMPERQCVNVTGDAGVSYMMGNFEAAVRYKIGITTVHINNACFAGYGPGFWGAGEDPYTCRVTPATLTNLAKAAEGLGLHGERVEDPSEIKGAFERAFEANRGGRPAYLEFLCSEYPVWGVWSGMGAKGDPAGQYPAHYGGR